MKKLKFLLLFVLGLLTFNTQAQTLTFKSCDVQIVSPDGDTSNNTFDFDAQMAYHANTMKLDITEDGKLITFDVDEAVTLTKKRTMLLINGGGYGVINGNTFTFHITYAVGNGVLKTIKIYRK